MATGGSILDSNHFELEPGNSACCDEVRVGRGCGHLGPHCARVPRVLTRGANRVILKRVGAEEVGGDLLLIGFEQSGLRRKECPGEGSAEG